MKKLLLLLGTFGFCLASSIVLEVKGSSIPKSDGLIDGFIGSYNIFIKDKYIYVSNLGNINFDGYDGHISKLDTDGRIIDKFFITGLEYPQGMTIIDDTIYVADRSIIKGFNLDSKKEVFRLTIEDNNNDNIIIYDIVAKDEDTLLVNSSYYVYEVHLQDRRYDTLESLKGKINSLFLYKDKLYVSGLYINVIGIDLSKKEVAPTPIITTIGNYYGITIKDDKLIVSNWSFNVSEEINNSRGANKDFFVLVDLNTKEETILDLSHLYIGGLVDMMFDEEGYLWILDTLRNRLIKVKIND